MKKKRDIRISISKHNLDILDLWDDVKRMELTPSHVVCKWLREKGKEWKRNQSKLLSAPQQKPEMKQTITKSRPVIKEESEEQHHKRRDEAIRIIDAKIAERSTFGEDINEKMKITIEAQIKKLQDEKARLINS